MNVLILGGMSPRHKDWVRQVAKALEPDFEKVAFIDYRHWDQPDGEMDLEYEIEQVAKVAEDLKDFVIVAKSIGTVVSTLAISRGSIVTKRCVFMGFPLKVIQKEISEMDSAIKSLPETTFVQNDQDPLGSAETVREYLQLHSPEDYEVYDTPGDTHDYIDFRLISRVGAK